MEKKLVGSVLVPLGKILNEISPSLCGRQVVA